MKFSTLASSVLLLAFSADAFTPTSLVRYVEIVKGDLLRCVDMRYKDTTSFLIGGETAKVMGFVLCWLIMGSASFLDANSNTLRDYT